MKTKKQQLGTMGEDMAVEYLRGKDYMIIKRNFRFGKNEIDIIAEDESDIVFLEVKSVRSPEYGSAEYRVPLKKQHKNLKQNIAYQKIRIL